MKVVWKHQDSGLLAHCPEYVVFAWCPKRRRFRAKETLAVGVPYDAWYRWGRSVPRVDEDSPNFIDYGQQLAAQNGLHWVKTFDPQWKLHDLMLMRLKGKV